VPTRETRDWHGSGVVTGGKMPSKKSFPSGELSVSRQQTSDVTAGLSFRPLDVEQIKYLWVSGIIHVGSVETTYDFTLIEYKLHIDETPWTIYSTLVNALETEFFEEFWDTVNYKRKGPTDEFHDVAWLEDADTYDVSSPYLDIRIPMLDKEGNTAKVAYPFVWDHTHLKAHPNGILIYSDHKRLEFLLQWVLTWHKPIPPTPLFWVNDDKGAKSMSLHRTSLWLHSETIEWLARTSEAFPIKLRDTIMPRIEQITKANPKLKPYAQTSGPKLGRWEKRPMHEKEEKPKPDPGIQEKAPKQTTDTSLEDKERRYLLLQAAMQTWPRNLTQRTRQPSRLRRVAHHPMHLCQERLNLSQALLRQ
jgi:hypothetical protein